MTDTKKRGILPKKKYLFVLLATRHCQLKFEDLLAYSFLVYRAGTKHPAVTQRRIADNLGLCRTTVRRSVRRLEELNLARKTDDGRWFGAEPNGKSDWFVMVKNTNTASWEWNKRFASFQLYLCRPKRMMPPTITAESDGEKHQPQPVGEQSAPTEPKNAPTGQDHLTPRENAVLWKIHSWNTGRVLMTVTHQGVATQLCLSRETVCRAIKRLKTMKLLDDDHQLALKDEYHRYWLDAPQKLRRNPKAEVPISLRDLSLQWYRPELPYELVFFPDRHGLGKRMDLFENMMRNAGYNSADILSYWRTTAYKFCESNPRHLECFMAKGFPTVFDVVSSIHAVKGAGYRNSVGLLKLKTEGVVRQIQSRDAKRQFTSYDNLLDWEPNPLEITYGKPPKQNDGVASAAS